MMARESKRPGSPDRGWLKVSVIRDEVLGVDVARGFARLCDLAEISRADIYDPKKNPKGTQRDLSPKHARDAYEYVAKEDLAFWPEIFLAVRDKSIINFKPLAANAKCGHIFINIASIRLMEKISISRVDGNHRLHYADGSHEQFPKIEKAVSFCIAMDLDLEEEIKLFRDINNNQRRMNTSHLDNIKIRIEGLNELARRDPHLYIAKRIADDSDSPLCGSIYDGGKSDINRFIPMRTLKTGIEYMLSRPTRLTALEEIDVKAKLIKNYFTAVREWEPMAWKKPKEYLMMRGAGFWGICFLGAEVIDRSLAKGKFQVKDMLQIMRSGREWDWSRNGDFQGYSGRAGALKIRDQIASELEDTSGVSLKTLAKQISEGL